MATEFVVPGGVVVPKKGASDPDRLNMIQNPPMVKAAYWLEREEAAMALEMDVRTIDRYVRANRVSYYRGVTQTGKLLKPGTVTLMVWKNDTLTPVVPSRVR